MTTDPHTDLRQRIAASVERLHETGGLYALDTGEPERIADAVLAELPPPADRAAVLRQEADRIDATRAEFPIAVQNGITWATAELRRHAAECPQCGDTGACNGGPCPLRRLADEAQQPEPPVHGESVAALAGYQPDGRDTRGGDEPAAEKEQPFTPAAHYRRDDGVECCVHTIPVGPNSCPACRELADDDGPATGPSAVDEVVAALQAKAQALSVEAEEEMRRDLEEQAQVWHEAADLARRTGRKAARRAQPADDARQDGEA